MCRGLVAGALLWALLAGAAHGEDDRLMSHLARVREFTCHEPQPRALEAEALVGARSDERVLPPCTVLHRCEAAGCCAARQVCAPLEWSPVTLWFNVSSSVHRDWRLRPVQERNHTRCSCQDPTEQRK